MPCIKDTLLKGYNRNTASGSHSRGHACTPFLDIITLQVAHRVQTEAGVAWRRVSQS